MDVRARAQEIADELLGSASSLNDVTTSDERDDIELLEVIDTMVMQCESCGWWFPTDEAPAGVCEDCEDVDT